MGPSRRFFRGMTRAGVVCCILILMAWFWSTRTSALYARDDWTVNLFSGTMRFEQSRLVAAQVTLNSRLHPPSTTIWSVVTLPSGLTSTYGFRGWEFTFGPRGRLVILPIWIIFTATALTTLGCALLCRWRGRRGHCFECGYCLTGNTSGVCPECGAEAPASVKIIPIVVGPGREPVLRPDGLR